MITMIKNKLFFLAFSLLLLTSKGSSQTKKINSDTLYIKKEYVKFCSDGFSLTLSAGKYYYNNQEIDKIKYEKIDKFITQICDSLLDYATGKYCKFYNTDSIVVEEGVWYREFYAGQYKSYYDNGKIKSLGNYSTDINGVNAGNKIDKWYFYTKDGKIKKMINYSKKK